jgi:hypothetical protein
VARSPRLWRGAARQALRLARQRWWRRRPFIPLPGERYVAFRAETMYGAAEHPLEVADVLNYLAWCQQMERWR